MSHGPLEQVGSWGIYPRTVDGTVEVMLHDGKSPERTPIRTIVLPEGTTEAEARQMVEGVMAEVAIGHAVMDAIEAALTERSAAAPSA